jgi:hypothetical protein
VARATVSQPLQSVSAQYFMCKRGLSASQASSAQDAQAQAEELRSLRAALGAPQHGQLQAGNGRPASSSGGVPQGLPQLVDMGPSASFPQHGPGLYRGGGGRQPHRGGRGRGSGRAHGGRGA